MFLIPSQVSIVRTPSSVAVCCSCCKICLQVLPDPLLPPNISRNHDSLLGRQGVTRSPLVWYRLPLIADQTGIPVIDAALTKDVAYPCHKMLHPFPDCILSLGHKMSRTSLGRRSRPPSALEQLYQNFCTNTREAGGLPLITTSFFSPKLLLFFPNVCHPVDHFQRKQDRQVRFLVRQCVGNFNCRSTLSHATKPNTGW